MDSLLEDFCRDVLEFHKYTLTPDRLQTLARHLRNETLPALERVEHEQTARRTAKVKA